MSTQIPHKLSWLQPYLPLFIPYLPRGVTITRIGSWSINNKRIGKECHAAIYTKNHKQYRIWLHTHRLVGTIKSTPQSKMDMLSTLAHELAHTWDMDHSPLHKMVEATLTQVFMKQLAAEGYVSEEEELGT